MAGAEGQEVLQDLYLCYEDMSAGVPQEVIDRLPTLRKLELHSSKLTDEGIGGLCEALRENRTLQSLHLWNNDIGDKGAAALAEALRANGALQSLDLHRNKIWAAGAAALAEALRANGALQSLHLGGNQIGETGAGALAEALRANGALQSLDLGYNNIGDAGVAALAEALRVNRTLQSLHLWSNNIGDAGAAALAEALRANGALQSLYLQGNQIGDTGAGALAEALRANGALQSLNLDRNKIGDAGAAALAEVLRENKSLQSLDLQMNEIGDAGAAALAEALVPHACGGDARGGEGQGKLAEAQSENRTVRRLDLCKNPIGAAGVRALREVQPQNTIHMRFDSQDPEAPDVRRGGGEDVYEEDPERSKPSDVRADDQVPQPNILHPLPLHSAAQCLRQCCRAAVACVWAMLTSIHSAAQCCCAAVTHVWVAVPTCIRSAAQRQRQEASKHSADVERPLVAEVVPSTLGNPMDPPAQVTTDAQGPAPERDKSDGEGSRSISSSAKIEDVPELLGGAALSSWLRGSAVPAPDSEWSAPQVEAGWARTVDFTPHFAVDHLELLTWKCVTFKEVNTGRSLRDMLHRDAKALRALLEWGMAWPISLVPEDKHDSWQEAVRFVQGFELEDCPVDRIAEERLSSAAAVSAELTLEERAEAVARQRVVVRSGEEALTVPSVNHLDWALNVIILVVLGWPKKGQKPQLVVVDAAQDGRAVDPLPFENLGVDSGYQRKGTPADGTPQSSDEADASSSSAGKLPAFLLSYPRWRKRPSDSPSTPTDCNSGPEHSSDFASASGSSRRRNKRSVVFPLSGSDSDPAAPVSPDIGDNSPGPEAVAESAASSFHNQAFRKMAWVTDHAEQPLICEPTTQPPSSSSGPTSTSGQPWENIVVSEAVEVRNGFIDDFKGADMGKEPPNRANSWP